jgi:hypothetical protein
MPIEMQRRRFLLDRAKVWALMTGICAGLLITSAQLLTARIDAYNNRLARGDAIEAQFAQARTDMQSVLERQIDFKKKQATLEKLAKTGQWEQSLRDVAAVAGDEIWIQSARIHVKNPHPTEAAIDASTPVAARFEMVGFAVSNAAFSEFRTRLNRTSRLRDIEPLNVQAAQLLKGRLIQFTVKGQLRLEADADQNANALRADAATPDDRPVAKEGRPS